MKRALKVFITVSILVCLGENLWAGRSKTCGLVTVAEKDVCIPSIIIPAQPHILVRASADDLQHYLEQITVMKLPIVQGKETKGFTIRVGNVPGNEELKSVIEAEKLGPEGFVLDISETGIRILGGSPLGTSHGVYELLERMGIRWLFPGLWGEVVPQKKTVTLSAGRFTDKPVFEIRGMHTAYVGEPFGDWARRQRHNRAGFFGHSSMLVKYRKEHPEWYAEIDGKRQPEDRHFKLCHSNPDMVQQAIKEVMEQIRKRKADTRVRRHVGYRHLAKDYFVISISPTDGGGFCQCAECRKMGSVSDRLQIFANTVAEAVRKEFPNYYVGYYGAYSEAQTPPTVAADPGVIVFFTTWTKDHFAPITTSANAIYRKKIEGFVKKCPSLAVRDFDGLQVWWGYGPMSRISVIAKDYQWYNKHGIRGVITEAHIGWGHWGQSYYVMGRLWWNPYADVEAIKRDFVSKGFGKAFEPMWRYYERLNKVIVYPSPHTLYAMRKDLEEAARLAKQADVIRRIDYIRAYHILWDIYKEIRSGYAKQEDILIAARLAKTIDYHVMHTKRWLKPLVEKNRAIQLAQAYSDEEFRSLLDSVKLAVPGDELPIWNNADDSRLRPLVSKAKAKTPASMGVNCRYGPHTILIWAKAGENIHIWQKNKSKTQYEIRGPEQAVIAEGLTEGLTDQEDIINLRAASDGIYKLTFSTRGHKPRIHIEHPYAVIKASSTLQKLHPFGKFTLYFYVPKGTKEFAFVTRADEKFKLSIYSSHDARQPMQPPIEQRTKVFEEHRFKVPEGCDDKVWKVHVGCEDMELFLMGIPPFLASDPARLLKRGN